MDRVEENTEEDFISGPLWLLTENHLVLIMENEDES
jgi:hypothetical protein